MIDLICYGPVLQPGALRGCCAGHDEGKSQVRRELDALLAKPNFRRVTLRMREGKRSRLKSRGDAVFNSLLARMASEAKLATQPKLHHHYDNRAPSFPTG
jgi:hypothetical protein